MGKGATRFIFVTLIAFATRRLGVLEIRRLEHVIFIRILLFPAETQSRRDLSRSFLCVSVPLWETFFFLPQSRRDTENCVVTRSAKVGR